MENKNGSQDPKNTTRKTNTPRKRRVEECFSIDSFFLARWMQTELAQNAMAQKGAARGYLQCQVDGTNTLSISLIRTPPEWRFWGCVMDQEPKTDKLWDTMEMILSNDIWCSDKPHLASRDASARAAWAVGQSFTFPFGTVYAPQNAGIERTTNRARASCEWFHCPAPRNGKPCARRCRNLYWHKGHLACRTCHNLAYASQSRGASRQGSKDRQGNKDHLLQKAKNEGRKSWRAYLKWRLRNGAMSRRSFRLHLHA